MFRSRLGKWSLFVGTLLLAIWVAQSWLGERTGITALLLYLPQHGWGLPPLLLLLLAARRDANSRRHFRLAIFNGAVLLGWAFFLLGCRFSGSSASPDSLRLMTYNIERGAGGTDALEAAIRAQNPDIVCLQESQGVYRNTRFAAGAAIAARFPNWHAAQSGDVMTISRFPIASQRSFPLRGTRRILETTLETPRGPLQVFNVHISTSFAKPANAPRRTMNRLWQVVSEAQPAAQVRLDQIAPLEHALKSCDPDAPLLLAGDFNSPPRGLFYRAISRNFDDTWLRGGRGSGNTFPANFPLLPIDHVLTRGLITQRARVPDVRASDHRPLVVDFSFADND